MELVDGLTLSCGHGKTLASVEEGMLLFVRKHENERCVSAIPLQELIHAASKKTLRLDKMSVLSS